jgi:hypothetical protein
MASVHRLFFTWSTDAGQSHPWRHIGPSKHTRNGASYDPTKARLDGEEGLKEAARHGDKARELKALLMLAIAEENLNVLPSLLKHAERGETLARELGDIGALSLFLTLKAFAISEGGSQAEGIRVLDEAIASAERYHEATSARCYVAKPVCMAFGRTADGEGLLLRGPQSPKRSTIICGRPLTWGVPAVFTMCRGQAKRS